jgi:predicted transcriptional regulator
MNNSNPYGISNKELEVCETLIETGFSDVSKADQKIISKDGVKEYLDYRRSSLEQNHPLTYTKKLDVLNEIIDLRKHIGVLAEALNINDIRSLTSVIISAIHESNLMQGHLAAEKKITAQITFDPSGLIDTLEDYRVKQLRLSQERAIECH